MEIHHSNMTPDELLLKEVCLAVISYILTIHALLNTKVNQEKLSDEQRLFLEKEREELQYFENKLVREKLSDKELWEILEELNIIKEKLFTLMMQAYYEENLKILMEEQRLLDYVNTQKSLEKLKELLKLADKCKEMTEKKEETVVVKKNKAFYSSTNNINRLISMNKGARNSSMFPEEEAAIKVPKPPDDESTQAEKHFAYSLQNRKRSGTSAVLASNKEQSVAKFR